MAITGNRAWSASSLSGLAVSYVQSGYRLRSPFSALPDDQYIAACAQDLRDVIDTTTSGDVACMIAEPIQGVGGFATPPDGFFAAIKDVLDRFGILFISDEVQTGFGRTGENFWGFQAHGIVPDMITFAKGVANGLPLGGVIARGDVMNAIHANSISTFGGNPVAIAAADATLSYILDHDLQANSLARGESLRSRLAPAVAHTPWIAELRGKGLMLALEMVVAGSIEPDAAKAGALHEAAKRRGLLIGKGGLYGNVLRIAPPMSVTQHEIDEAADVLLAAIDEVGGG
jgi:4-aminobutyrate aminotransferase